MFVAIIVALTSVQLTHFFEKHHLVIKMPDAVPEFLQDTFRSLIPLVVNAIIWTVLGYGCVALTQTALPVLITGLLGMPLADKCSRNYFYRNHCQSVMDDGCPWNSGGICGNRSTVNAVLCNQLCQS